MSYTSYDHDRLEAAEKLKIERTIYFQSEKSDIAELTALPLAELIRQKEESAAAEENIYSSLREQATAWEEQAGKTLSLEKAIEYARTPAVQHTSNKWQERDHDRREISNAVYRMNYYVYENTRYDREKKESVPYSYSLTWNVYTNGPERNRQMKIAGQDRKVFADRAAMEKYLAGRQKAYANLFTEVSPQIPKQYAECFKVNGVLLPGYTIEGEERGKPEQAPAEQRTTTESKDEQFAILLDSRSRFETGEAGGYWLSMPATKEQLQEALAGIGLTADKPQDLFIRGFSDTEEKPLALPYDMVCSANIDELNFLAARLENLDASGVAALNAAAQRKQGFENVGQIIDFTYNEDFFVHIPEVRTPAELGNYYLNKSGMVQMPDEWKAGVDLAAFGQNAAEKEKGSFTDYGYILESGDDWVKHYEGREVPEEYRIMSSAQAPQIDPAKVDMDISAVQTAEQINVQTKEPQPVIPIILTSENPAGKLKEITDRLEQGITELFNSERFKEYLQVMSKFHNYSFNNTLLIAMQKPDASHIVGFSAWKNTFKRNVMKGQKGIKILAPSPYTVKKEIEKIDPLTQKPVIGKDGKPVTEDKEITIPAFKVVSVFDVSQTEGKELPNIAVDTLTGNVELYEDFFKALKETSPVPIAFEKIEGGAHGYYHLEDKRIAIDEGMSELQTIKTAIHEIAHAKLHDIDLTSPMDGQNRVDRRTREVEAESVAYTVCQHYGLDTSDYSFGYVAGWSSGRELADLKSSLETIRSAAAEIINSIDGKLAEIQKAQYKEQAPKEQTAEPDRDTYSIYQLKRDEATQDLRFEPYDRLIATGHEVDRANYDLVYTAPLTEDMTLNTIWEKFNIDHPKDFKGHSLSVSDIVVLHQNGGDTAHYVDSIGYQQVPEFLKKHTPLIPDEHLTGEKIRTPRGSFSLTDMTAEQMKEAGYGLHHTSDDGKYHIMGNGTRAFAIAAEPPEKTNPLKHIEDTVEQNDNNFDGIINNTPQTPTVGELEQKVKAGEPISLVDLANAMKAEKAQGKEKSKTPARREEKPSIREQLKKAKETAAPKKAAKQKNHDLEV